MARSPLPLVALMGAAMGCTQDASAPDEASYDDDSHPLLQQLKGENTGKGSSLRGLSPEERASLVPRPIPVPEGWRARDASVEPEDAGSAAPDYAEQRRQLYEQRMQQLQEDAALRDAGVERTLEERAADETLATGPVPQDIAGQRRQQIAKERMETERFRKFGKGGGMKRSEIIHIIRDPDGGTGTSGGTQAVVKE